MRPAPAFELADVVRRHGGSYARENAGHLGRVERRVLAAIAACRTAALGGHVERCDDCGLTRIAYNSCIMGKICNGESAIVRAANLSVFRMVRRRFPRAFLPIR